MSIEVKITGSVSTARLSHLDRVLREAGAGAGTESPFTWLRIRYATIVAYGIRNAID
jgi:hypothetical protein